MPYSPPTRSVIVCGCIRFETLKKAPLRRLFIVRVFRVHLHLSIYVLRSHTNINQLDPRLPLSPLDLPSEAGPRATGPSARIRKGYNKLSPSTTSRRYLYPPARHLFPTCCQLFFLNTANRYIHTSGLVSIRPSRLIRPAPQRP